MKLMFTGHNEQHKVYKMIGIATNKVAFSWDIIVDERKYISAHSYLKMIVVVWLKNQAQCMGKQGGRETLWSWCKRRIQQQSGWKLSKLSRKHHWFGGPSRKEKAKMVLSHSRGCLVGGANEERPSRWPMRTCKKYEQVNFTLITVVIILFNLKLMNRSKGDLNGREPRKSNITHSWKTLHGCWSCL